MEINKNIDPPRLPNRCEAFVKFLLSVSKACLWCLAGALMYVKEIVSAHPVLDLQSGFFSRSIVSRCWNIPIFLCGGSQNLEADVAVTPGFKILSRVFSGSALNLKFRFYHYYQREY